ncbi:MAG: polyamine ABC transporter ATP-binding protein [Proteobacteria bacterium]|nr:polyamine ABC transporter ATP-binding protein [Pseudomonadota bacterium]NIS71042.1 polyamine ABC transporter ATP-binding protein [Pseudomonadota bacterium]
MEFTVELNRVTKKFGDVVAADNVSLQIGRGEFFSLLGPSGCGKTTTLRLIAGFEEPTEGEIFINNENVRDKRPYERDVNTVFQSYALFPHLTVAGNIAFGLERKKTPRHEMGRLIEEALDLVRLKGMGDRYPRQLSGGQQQRVALARALVLKPEVLLLDEPLGALDLKLRKEMQLELKSLQEKVGITFIYVTHDQEEALTMSDRIAVMERGRLEQVGTPEEIYEFPKTRFVADFIGVSNFFSGQVIRAEGETLLVRTDGNLDVTLPLDHGFTEGQRVQFSIRPEKFSVGPQGKGRDGENELVGEIANRIYLGGSIHYVIALSAEEKVTVFLKNERTAGQQPSFSVGERVTVSWHRDDSVILGD